MINSMIMIIGHSMLLILWIL